MVLLRQNTERTQESVCGGGVGPHVMYLLCLSTRNSYILFSLNDLLCSSETQTLYAECPREALMCLSIWLWHGVFISGGYGKCHPDFPDEVQGR